MQNKKLIRLFKRNSKNIHHFCFVPAHWYSATTGLLDGYKTTTRIGFHSTCEIISCRSRENKVVVDRNRITGGGVTAGIDFGLSVFAAELFGEDVAKTHSFMEYNPAPPVFNAGSPEQQRK